MSMSDPIADMLTRIRNANTAKHDTVDIPASKMKLAIADILLKEGYVKAVDVVEEGNFKTIKIHLSMVQTRTRRSLQVLRESLSLVFVYMHQRMSFQRYSVASVQQSSLQIRVY